MTLGLAKPNFWPTLGTIGTEPRTKRPASTQCHSSVQVFGRGSCVLAKHFRCSRAAQWKYPQNLMQHPC